MGCQIALGDNLAINPVVLGRAFGGAAQVVHILGAVRQFGFAVRMAVDINAMRLGDLFNQPDRIAFRLAILQPARAANAPVQTCVVNPRATQTAKAAVAPGRAPAHVFGFQNNNINTRLRQMQCRRQAGEAAPDDGHVAGNIRL